MSGSSSVRVLMSARCKLWELREVGGLFCLGSLRTIDDVCELVKMSGSVSVVGGTEGILLLAGRLR